MKKVYFFILSIILLMLALLRPASAGVFSLSSLSRANCINNESITWDLTTTWQMLVQSHQWELDTGQYLLLSDLQYDANRAAAVCWGCGVTGNWEVVGDHFVAPPSSLPHIPDRVDEEGKELLEFNCAGWMYTGDGDFTTPCLTTTATGCNATDWRGTQAGE